MIGSPLTPPFASSRVDHLHHYQHLQQLDTSPTSLATTLWSLVSLGSTTLPPPQSPKSYCYPVAPSPTDLARAHEHASFVHAAAGLLLPSALVRPRQHAYPRASRSGPTTLAHLSSYCYRSSLSTHSPPSTSHILPTVIEIPHVNSTTTDACVTPAQSQAKYIRPCSPTIARLRLQSAVRALHTPSHGACQHDAKRHAWPRPSERHATATTWQHQRPSRRADCAQPQRRGTQVPTFVAGHGTNGL